MTSRRIVDRQPIPEFPGWELRTVELTIPPGTQTQHTHPRVGINYIVKGELHTKFVGKELEKVKQGDGFLDLPDLVHEVIHNPGTENTVIVVSYVIKEDQPNVEPLKQ